MSVTAYQLAQRYMRVVVERPGAEQHPAIQFWLELCKFGRGAADETPWCSAFANFIAWQLDLPRPDSARARSWLEVGTPVALDEAIVGFDVVILERGVSGGHVGFFDARSAKTVFLLGGNQSNAVTIHGFDRARVLGVRRLA